MAAASSNNGEATGYADGGEKRPLMLYLQRRIPHKLNILTNAQIIDIIHSDLDTWILSYHEFEVDWYIFIIREFLDLWPGWNAFDIISTRLKKRKDLELLTKLLDKMYKDLREQLRSLLESSILVPKEKPKEESKPVEMFEPQFTEVDEESDSSEIVIEITCTKEH